MVLFLGFGPSFVNLGIVTVVSVHPARWCTSPLGVVPAGLGEGVGLCHDDAKLPRVCLFISLFLSFSESMFHSCFKGMVLGIFIPLGMLVAEWVPTPCYNDACLVSTPKWAFWEKGWLKHCKTMISPFIGRLFLVSKRTFYFFGELSGGCFILGGPGILCLALVFFCLVSFPLSLSMWLPG